MIYLLFTLILKVLMTRPESQSEEFNKFVKYLTELKLQTHHRLTVTVEDEASNRQAFHDLTER